MAEIERYYNIPMRDAKKIPRTQRASYAVKTIRKFLESHMEADKENMWIDPKINEMIWARGMQKIPNSVRVRVIKFEDDLVEVSLPEE